MQTLTPRQKQVLRMLILTGGKNDQLAKLLGMTGRTVKFHIESLVVFFGVATRLELQALVTTRVLSELSQVQGQPKFSTNPDRRALQASKLLSNIFEGDESPLGQTFTELLRPRDLKVKS